MSSHAFRQQESGDTTGTSIEFRGRDEDTRHCREDALSELEFERAVQAAYGLDDDYFGLECRLVLFLAGRMGLRSGEIVHMSAEWIDRDTETITIPWF